MVCSNCKSCDHNRRRCTVALNVVNAAQQGLRGTLPSLTNVWEYRNHTDAYSQKGHDITQNPEIDHVFEIQLLDLAYEEYLMNPDVRGVTRQERARVIQVANCLENTNVTSQSINRSKKGPFTRAKNELRKEGFDSSNCKGVDYYVYTKKGARRANTYTGFSTNAWENIKEEVVASFDTLNTKMNEAVYVERNAEIMQDCLYEVFHSLHID